MQATNEYSTLDREDVEPPSEYACLMCTQLAIVPLVYLGLDVTTVLLLITLLVLVFLSAIVSGSEVAFFSLSPMDLENIENQNTLASNKVIKLKQRPKGLLATILVANNFINIGIVILSDYILSRAFGEGFYETCGVKLSSFLNFGFSPELYSSIIRFGITVVLVTTILVLFGEVLPKIYAKINNVELSLTVATPMWITYKALYPLTSILVKYFSGLERGLSRIDVGDTTSKDEISKAIELTITNNAMSGGVDILKRIIKFGEVTVKEIMRPRLDVIALDESRQYHDILEIVRSSGFSRFPVYGEDFDDIVGILYTKDLLIFLDKGPEFNWQAMVRPEVKYVPESKMINELIKEMQSERKHMVVVVDEFGGTSGIVTLEDVMEEVIGDIKDEFDDDDEIEYEQIGDRTFVFDGRTNLNDMCRVLNLEIDYFNDFRGDSDSVAGLLLELHGEIPKKNYKIDLKNHQFSIVTANNRRIEKIQIVKPA